MVSRYEDRDDHSRNEGNNQDVEYQPYDDNNYNNAINDRVYPWEDFGKFDKDHLSTSAEVTGNYDRKFV